MVGAKQLRRILFFFLSPEPAETALVAGTEVLGVGAASLIEGSSSSSSSSSESNPSSKMSSLAELELDE